MSAILRPTRLEANDRFPMIGFTIRTHGEPRRAEVVVGTDPELFTAAGKARRTPSNFYSSRAAGPLTAARGEAVFILPPEVVARFVGAEKLYFGLATAPASGPAAFVVDMMPTAASPYVSLRGLTGRSIRRMRVLPTRMRADAPGTLEWAGDAAQPGQAPAQRAATAPANDKAQPAAEPVPYDDGFGDWKDHDRAPAPAQANPSAPSAAAPPAAPPPAGNASSQPAAPTAQSYFSSQPSRRAAALAVGDPVITGEKQPVVPPSFVELGTIARAAAELALQALPPPLGPLVTALRLAAQASAAAGSPVTIGLGPSVGAGLGAGVSLGAGLLFGPNGEIGVYGSGQFDIGFVTSISATAQVTVVKGGVSGFGGWSMAATISGGEAIVGGASALFDMSGNFQGVSVQAGIGAGFSPVDFYISVQRSVAVTFGMAAALGQRGRPSRALSDDGPTVEVKYRMFIPSPAIDSPFTVYGGDGRSFGYAGGTSRGEITANVRMTSGGGIAGVDIVDAHWGESTAYATGDTYHPDGKPDWWREKVDGAQPTERATCPRTTDNLNVTVGAPGTTRNIQAMAEQASIVTINASGSLPLSSIAPAIDADMSVMLRLAGGGVEAKAVGSHDGFPAHELYVNGTRIYAYDPVAAGSSPTALAPPMDVDVDTGWTNVTNAGATAQSLARGTARANPARAFDAEIPLDPGVGGQSIAMEALEIGDIILSTTDANISRAIRAFTSGNVSHAMLYVGQGGQVVEAVGEGVRLVPLGDALADATVAVAFRVPGLTPVQKQQVADAAGQQIGKPYNFLGVARQAAFQIDQRLCERLPNGLSDRCRAFVGRIDLGTADNASFFCSQLILDAYAAAGAALTSEPAHWASPEDIADLRFDFARLRYVGHLKAAPSTGLFGHLFSYAAKKSARALDAENTSFSINWDDVELLPQSSSTNCWAAAATMVVGWNRQQCIDPAMIGQIGAAIGFSGQADVASNERFARAIGLVAEPPMDYSAEGFRRLLENYGPLWVGKVMGSTPPWNASSHAVVVTGMYNDGTDIYLRVTDPWDRLVGSPGTPGSYQPTHTTGSRYIMRYDDFMREYDADQMSDPVNLHTMVLRPSGTSGRTPNYGSAQPAGYAQSLSARLAPPPPPTLRSRARGLDAGPPLPVQRRTERAEKGGVQFELEQLDGTRSPEVQAMVAAPVLKAEVAVEDWPRMPGDRGGCFGGVRVSWEHSAGSIGNVRAIPSDAALSDGWTLTVGGRVCDGPDGAAQANETVELHYHFAHDGEAPHDALVKLLIRGDGSFERTNEWLPVTAPSQTPAPAQAGSY